MKEIFRKEVMEKDVLNRIKWDKRLNPADFDIYYLDRITKKLERMKFTDIKFEGDFFCIGESFVPMHRIRKITSKGEIVWSRESAL